MPIVRFRLNISPVLYHEYYAGSANEVVCTANDGRTIRFPASKLRPFITHAGIYGEFEIEFSEHNKFIGMRKLN